jgi:hypothetical protein
MASQLAYRSTGQPAAQHTRRYTNWALACLSVLALANDHKQAAFWLLLASSYRFSHYIEVIEDSAGQIPGTEVASGSKVYIYGHPLLLR